MDNRKKDISMEKIVLMIRITLRKLSKKEIFFIILQKKQKINL